MSWAACPLRVLQTRTSNERDNRDETTAHGRSKHFKAPLDPDSINIYLYARFEALGGMR